MTWAVILRYGTVIAVVVGIMYWISDQRYQAGYLKGYEAGVEEATKKTNELRDQEFEKLLAQRGEEQEKRLRELNNNFRDLENFFAEQMETNHAKATQRLLAAINERDRVLEQLRDARTEREIRDANDRRRLPQATPSLPAISVSAGILSERGERRLVGRATDSEQLNVWYGQCLRAYEAVRDGTVTHVQP